MKKKVAILIPVFNHISFTRKCVQGLNKLMGETDFTHSEYHVVVIDDGSTDGTAEWLEENHPEVSVLMGDGNLWWSGGINAGARHAMNMLKVDFLLLWNNDILPAPDYFNQLDQLVNEMDEKTIAGSKIFYYRQGLTDEIWSFGGLFNPRNGKKSMLAYNMYDSEDFAQPVSVDWLPGMGTLVPVEIVKEIGLWDDQIFPLYHGDSDFTFRAKTAGYQIIAYPQLKLWNDKTVSGIRHGGSVKGFIKTLTDRRSNSNFKDYYRFYRRHSSSSWAYKELLVYYFIFFGSFIKWQTLGLFGIRKKQT